MLLKTSYFSAAIFKKNITRFWLLVVTYLAAQLLVLPLVLQTQIGYDFFGLNPDDRLLSAVRTVYQTLQFTNIIAFFGAAASAMAIFSYLYSARSANMMASLPVRRESMFLSGVASIYAVVIIVNLIAVIIALMVGLAHGVMLLKWLLVWFAAVLAQFTLYFGLAVLCAHLTGSIVAMPAIYAVANFAAVCFGAVIVEIANDLTYGLSMSLPRIFEFFTPFVNLMSNGYRYEGEYGPKGEQLVENIVLEQPTELAIYAAVGIVFLLIAFFLCRRRAMESAGDVVAVRILQPVFKILCCFAAGLGGGFLFFAAFLNYMGREGKALRLIAAVVVIGFVGYMLAEMLVKKTTRIKVKKAAVPALVMCLVMAAGIWSVDADLWGMESCVPEVGEVKQVTLGTSGGELTFTEDNDIGWVTALHQTALDNQEKNESEYNNFDLTLRFDYVLEDGSTIYRRYRVQYEDENIASPEAELVDRIMNSPENILRRKETDIPFTLKNVSRMNIVNVIDEVTGEIDSVNFTPEEAYELYSQCIYPDMRDGTIGIINAGNSGQLHEFYRNEITIWLQSDVKPESNDPYVTAYAAKYIVAYEGAEITYPDGRQRWEEHFYTYPTPESWRTNAWLESHGINLCLEPVYYK